MASFANTPCAFIEDGSPATLFEAAGVADSLLLDFWTTTCVRCPDALERLDRLAPTLRARHGITSLSVNLDDGERARGMVHDLKNLIHVGVDARERAYLKECIGMARVPFYVLIKGGQVVAQGAKISVGDVQIPPPCAPARDCEGGACGLRPARTALTATAES